MDVPFYSDQVLCEDVRFCRWDALLGTVAFAGRCYLLDVFLDVYTRYVTTVQDVVDVLQHLLVYYLSVTE